MPDYPPLARAAQVSGSVVVEVAIDEEGNVFHARALSGHPLLKDAAIEAARGWKFAPTTLEGKAVKVIGSLTFNFTP
jgi:protein TonB